MMLNLSCENSGGGDSGGGLFETTPSVSSPNSFSVSFSENKTYQAGEQISIYLTHPQVITVSGTPSIDLVIGSNTRQASYISGSGTTLLIFSYTVQATDLDTDGIEIASTVNLPSDPFTFSQNGIVTEVPSSLVIPNTTGLLVGNMPTVDLTAISNITLANESAITLSGNCSEEGQTVSVDIGGFVFSPNCTAGTYSTGAQNLSSLIDGSIDIEVTHSNGVIDATPANSSVTKDATAPTVNSVTPVANAAYKIADQIDFTVLFDELVNVSGEPRLELLVGATTKYANYVSGSGSSSLIFRYTISPGDEDTDGLSFSSHAIDLNSGSIADTLGNPSQLDLDLVSALPSLSGITVYGNAPTVSITSAANITSANQSAYSVSGTCSLNGATVSTNIGGILLTPVCSGGSWSTGSQDVSGLTDNPSISITADHQDVAGNNAAQASVTVSKDIAVPSVAITTYPNIDQTNATSYAAAGTCSENSRIVSLNIGGITLSPNCSGGTWSISNINVSSLSDNGSITFTADHDNVDGTNAPQASVSISKDTAAPTVTISSAPNITSANVDNYTVSGTCSEDTRTVDVYIDSIYLTPSCNGGSWTTGSQDVSSLSDGSGISITADHDNAGGTPANQASTTVDKNTTGPSVSNFSSPSTLKNSADLVWTLNNPGANTINDYIVNYRVKGNSTWLSFSDGVSTDLAMTINTLNASTNYEFRIAVAYDSTEQSGWSQIVEAETKPDSPLFNGNYIMLNLGGATDTNIVALENNTRVYYEDSEIPESPLSKGEVVNLSGTARYEKIEGDKPIFVAGRIGSGANPQDKANVIWSPTTWAGKTFTFNAYRNNPHNVYIYAVEATTVQATQGTNILDSATIAAGATAQLQWNEMGSYQINSTGTIIAYHVSGSPGSYYDPKPLPPSANEIIGFPSTRALLTTDKDNTNYTMIHSNSNSSTGSLDKADDIYISPQGTTTLYLSESILITADQKISGASYADSNGYCAAPFIPTNIMKKKYVINSDSHWVAFASKQPGTIKIYSPTQTIGVDTPVETLTLSRSGANSNAPYKARTQTAITQGYRYISNVPMAGWYQPNNDAGSATEDETVMYGFD